MHLLRSSLFLLLFPLLTLSCKPLGPLTPAESFAQLKKAAQGGDARKVVQLLSGKSMRKIENTVENLKSLDDQQAVNLSRIYGIGSDRIRNLSVEDFIRVYLNIKGNILLQIVEQNPVAIDLKVPEAAIRVENGMTIYFVKEGPYWKFDFTRL